MEFKETLGTSLPNECNKQTDEKITYVWAKHGELIMNKVKKKKKNPWKGKGSPYNISI